MTAQINDVFRYKGDEYSVAGISEGELFSPAIFGMNPVMASTACWRGYQATFALSGHRLVLEALRVNLVKEGKKGGREPGPAIGGIEPRERGERAFFFNNLYEGLSHPLPYTGGLLLADSFINELYVHMGFHPAWKYERVVELVFDAGVLKAEHDRSEKMAEFRRRFASEAGGSRSEHSSEEIANFVLRAFDRSYGR